MKIQESKSGSAPFLTHINVNTGLVTASSRRDISDTYITSMVDLINTAKTEIDAHSGTECLKFKIPFDESYTVVLTRCSSNLVGKLYHESFGLVLRLATALRSDEGIALWSELGGMSDQPPVPWCAVRIEHGMRLALLSRPDVVHWFGSFERDLAWAWYELNPTTAAKDIPGSTSQKCEDDSIPEKISTVGLKRQLFAVGNKGQELVRTDYWATSQAKSGEFFLSVNAGVLRLLVPSAQEKHLKEMQRVTEVSVESSILNPGRAFDIVFEDGTSSPFCISIGREHKDRKLTPGQTKLVVYSENYGKTVSLSCRIDRSAESSLVAC